MPNFTEEINFLRQENASSRARISNLEEKIKEFNVKIEKLIKKKKPRKRYTKCGTTCGQDLKDGGRCGHDGYVELNGRCQFHKKFTPSGHLCMTLENGIVCQEQGFREFCGYCEIHKPIFGEGVS